MSNVMRHEVTSLLALGPLPLSGRATGESIRLFEDALARIPKPLTDDEARSLVDLFCPDDFFGLAWTLIQLIETAPGWPIQEALRDTSNDWVVRLRERATRGAAPHAA